MFDKIFGLPVHVLVLHSVVVLLPLMALLTIVTAVRPGLRERFTWWVTGANALVFGLTLVAKESGQALQAALGVRSRRSTASSGRCCPTSRSSSW